MTLAKLKRKSIAMRTLNCATQHADHRDLRSARATLSLALSRLGPSPRALALALAVPVRVGVSTKRTRCFQLRQK